MRGLRGTWAWAALLAAGLALGAEQAGALAVTPCYSPLNRERPLRARTDYIILHTTEGRMPGALRKVRASGEAHYFVDTCGRVYAVVDHRRVACHAGRSMWNGRTELDRCSLGLEVEGYHNRDITPAQYGALRALLAQLKARYGVTDERVLTHSMVAYGLPNPWHRHSHRGRKRCGMLLARRDARQRLGLAAGPARDPDVHAGRLTNADAHLARVLYGRSALPGRSTAGSVRPAAAPGVIRGAPLALKVLGVDGSTAAAIAGAAYKRRSTIYFLPDGRVRRGDQLTDAAFRALPRGTRVLVGYAQAGCVTPRTGPFELCGRRWNQPSTFYRFPDGRLLPGSSVNPRGIPRDTTVFVPT